MGPLARAGLVTTLLASLLLAGTSTPATAADAIPSPSILDKLINPKPLDPVIGLLPPLPVKHTPYVGDVCPDGSPSCIDTTIAEMQRRLGISAAACDHDAIFDLAYLRVTENVREAVSSGVFDDRVWLGQVDAVFAKLYFDSMDAWHSGDPARRKATPKAWQIALKAADDRSVSGLGNFLLAMNAHINRDFSYVLAEIGLTGADGTSHKKDHNAYNRRLDGLYAPVFAEEAARFDPTVRRHRHRAGRGDRGRRDHARLARDRVAQRRAARPRQDAWAAPHRRADDRVLRSHAGPADPQGLLGIRLLLRQAGRLVRRARHRFLTD